MDPNRHQWIQWTPMDTTNGHQWTPTRTNGCHCISLDACGIQWPVESNGLHLTPVDPIGFSWAPMGSFKLPWGSIGPLHT
eukprot:11200536-Lingulodinium_polyedra.AAC.1